MSKMSNQSRFTLIELMIYVLIVTVVGFILVGPKFLWGWIVPDLFPGAVDQGLVAKSISWWTSLKISVVLLLLRAPILKK